MMVVGLKTIKFCTGIVETTYLTLTFKSQGHSDLILICDTPTMYETLKSPHNRLQQYCILQCNLSNN